MSVKKGSKTGGNYLPAPIGTGGPIKELPEINHTGGQDSWPLPEDPNDLRESYGLFPTEGD